MTFYYRPDCKDCLMVKAWLDKHGVEYEERDMNTQPLTGEQLLEWAQKYHFPMRAFIRPRKFSLKAILIMNQMLNLERHARAFVIAAAHEYMVCPIMEGEDFVVMGLDNAQWRKALNIQS